VGLDEPLDEPASWAGVKVLQILIDVLVAVGAAEVGNTAVRVEPEVLSGSGADVANVIASLPRLVVPVQFPRDEGAFSSGVPLVYCLSGEVVVLP